MTVESVRIMLDLIPVRLPRRKARTCALSAVCLIILSQPTLAQLTQPFLKITSQTDGTTVAPGQNITLTAEATRSLTLTKAMVSEAQPIDLATTVSSGPVQFSIAVPEKIGIGTHQLMVAGLAESGQSVQSEPIRLDIERADAPTKLTAEPEEITFDSPDGQIPLRIIGTFSDGAVLDVTGSTKMAYSSSSNDVATVDAVGGVTAVGHGNSSVLASYEQAGQSIQVSMSVMVRGWPMNLAPPNLAFGSPLVDTDSIPQTLTLTNDSDAELGALSVSTEGDFLEEDDCRIASIPPRGTCSITVSFHPSAVGARDAALSVTDESSGSVQIVSLTGMGADFGFSVVGDPPSATVVAGQSATFHMQMNPLGGFTGSVALSCTGAPAFSTCTSSPTSVAIAGSSAVPFTLSVSTAAPSLTPPATLHLWLSIPYRRFFTGVILLLAISVSGITLADRLLPICTWAPSWILLISLSIFLPGCGGVTWTGGEESGSHGTPVGTYTLTVTGTSQGVSRTVSVILTVT